MKQPDYERIYKEMIKKEKIETTVLSDILSKTEWNSLDVIKANDTIYKNECKETNKFNQQHRSYDESSIKEILAYQKVNQLTNIQTANKFKLSKNTLAKWKKVFTESNLYNNKNLI